MEHKSQILMSVCPYERFCCCDCCSFFYTEFLSVAPITLIASAIQFARQMRVPRHTISHMYMYNMHLARSHKLLLIFIEFTSFKNSLFFFPLWNLIILYRTFDKGEKISRKKNCFFYCCQLLK